MPKLYANGLVSDVNVSSGAQITPAARDTAVLTARQTAEAAKAAARLVDEAMKWLSDKARSVTPVGTPVLQTTVETAAGNAGVALWDIRTAITNMSSGLLPRFSKDAVAGTITRRF